MGGEPVVNVLDVWGANAAGGAMDLSCYRYRLRYIQRCLDLMLFCVTPLHLIGAEIADWSCGPTRCCFFCPAYSGSLCLDPSA